MLHHYQPTAFDGLFHAMIALFILVAIPATFGWGLYKIVSIMQFFTR